MNILIITPQLPYPPHQGTILRNYHIIKGVTQTHQVTLLTYLESSQPPLPTDWGDLGDLCHQIVTVPLVPRAMGQRIRQLVSSGWPDLAHRLHTPPFIDVLQALLDKTDFAIAQIEGLELAWAMPIIATAQPACRLVFDAHNAETALQQRALATDWRQPRRWVAALYSAIQVGRLRRFERWAVEMAAAVTAVSDTDTAILSQLEPTTSGPIVTIPNTIDVEQYQPPANFPSDLPRFDLVFSGKMDYRPNIDGVVWFAETVWPLIRAQRPATEWVIVGNKPTAAVVALGQIPGITVTGWVDTIQPYLWGAKIAILPLRMGSGTRLKLIEAAAAGIGIVSTTVGAEGFDLQDGGVIRLADTPAAMAAAVLALLQDDGYRQALGSRAQEWAEQYDWRQVVPRFLTLYAQLQQATTQ